jgi:hypothetical protein
MTGAALEGRLRSHINMARTGKKLCHKDNWIRSQLASGTRPTIHEIERGQGPSWAERERFWIADYKARGFDLTNISLGGDSAPKGEFSPEHREAMSKAHKGIKFTAEHKERIRAALKGRVLPQETVDKIKATKKANPRKPTPISEETREKLRVASKDRRPSREAIEKARIANTGRVASDETRAKMRAAQLLSWQRRREAKNANSRTHALNLIISPRG